MPATWRKLNEKEKHKMKPKPNKIDDYFHYYCCVLMALNELTRTRAHKYFKLRSIFEINK